VNAATKSRYVVFAILLAIFTIWRLVFWPQRSSIYAPDDWERLASEGVKAMNDHDLDRAEVLFDQAQNFLKNSPPDDIRRATVLHDLGEVEGLRRHFDKAQEFLLASIKVFDANPNREDPEKAIALRDVAIADIALKEPDQSLNHFEQAIALEQKLEGPNGSDLARFLREYAGILLLEGRIADSTRAIRRATDIENDKGEKWLPTTSPSTEPAVESTRPIETVLESRSSHILFIQL
jgi:tetratricopeptide (TPR) repeat protein